MAIDALLIAAIAALIFGIVAVIDSAPRFRAWAGWGVICLAAGIIYTKML